MREVKVNTLDLIKSMNTYPYQWNSGSAIIEINHSAKYIYCCACPRGIEKFREAKYEDAVLFQVSFDKSNWQPIVVGATYEMPQKQAQNIYVKIDLTKAPYFHTTRLLPNFQIVFMLMERNELDYMRFQNYRSDGWIPLLLNYDLDIISNFGISRWTGQWLDLYTAVLPNLDNIEFKASFKIKPSNSLGSNIYRDSYPGYNNDLPYQMLIQPFRSIMLEAYEQTDEDVSSEDIEGYQNKSVSGFNIHGQNPTLWAEFEYPENRATLNSGQGIFNVRVLCEQTCSTKLLIPAGPCRDIYERDIIWGLYWRSKINNDIAQPLIR